MKKLALLFAGSLLAVTMTGARTFAKGTAAPPKVKVTAKQATATALHRYHGKVVGKVELENEEGKWQYAVNVRSGKTLREVMVDANTGKIASVEVTSAKEEAKEKAAGKKGKESDEKGEKGEKREKGDKGESGEND